MFEGIRNSSGAHTYTFANIYLYILYTFVYYIYKLAVKNFSQLMLTISTKYSIYYLNSFGEFSYFISYLSSILIFNDSLELSHVIMWLSLSFNLHQKIGN